MDREQAQLERERLAAEHPEATWLVAEQRPGEWAVVRVGIPAGDSERVETAERRPVPPYAKDPRSTIGRNVSGYGGAL